MNIDDKVLTLSNDEKYMVIESLEHDNKKYAYIVNLDKQLDAKFIEVKNENGLIVEEVEKQYLQEKILPLFLDKFSKY